MPHDAKTLGAYFTPEVVADAPVRWAVRSPDDLLLDPSLHRGVQARQDAPKPGGQRGRDAARVSPLEER